MLPYLTLQIISFDDGALSLLLDSDIFALNSCFVHLSTVAKKYSLLNSALLIVSNSGGGPLKRVFVVLL